MKGFSHMMIKMHFKLKMASKKIANIKKALFDD
jgi:hypothetical protein